MNTDIPIKIVDGVELIPKSTGICTVTVNDSSAKQNLSWDRFVRLNAAAKALKTAGAKTILDAGGYDGALGFFLSGVTIDLIDPATTGGSILEIPVADEAYDAVVAVDVLEHIAPKDRTKAIAELARVAKTHIILNYPCSDSKEAQELVLRLTNNPLIEEHVKWELPDSDWVLSELEKHHFNGTITGHTSIATWLGQYVSLNLVPDKAVELNRHLVEHYAEEPCGRTLYHLIVCRRD